MKETREMKVFEFAKGEPTKAELEYARKLELEAEATVAEWDEVYEKESTR